MELNLVIVVAFDHVITSFLKQIVLNIKEILDTYLGGYENDCLDHRTYICAYGNPLAIIELRPIYEKVANDIFIGR